MKLTAQLNIRIKMSYNTFRKTIIVKIISYKNLLNKICTYVWSFLKKDK